MIARKKGNSGAKNNNWRGGKVLASNGYILVRCPGHHLADVRGYAYEHRIVAETKIRRPLEKGEIIHHIDGDKTNNTPDNLTVEADISNHMNRHGKNPSKLPLNGENPLINCACGCGRTLEKYDSSGRPRKYISGHNDRPAPMQLKIIELVGNGSCRIPEIVILTECTTNRITALVSKMAKEGKLIKVRHGVYGLPLKGGEL